MNKEIDVIKNMKTIEWLKAELLSNISQLYKDMANNEDTSRENLEDLISNIILESYVLAKRLGIDYKSLDKALKGNIKLNLVEEHKIERWYGDLSALMEHIETAEE
ncbi:MazG-like family protein [Tissierella creatinophila]|uniref:MazG-like family protein n=1 Tax=Tissierella creatinophila DSM 6911 TaxID=1123403 RepID=A0A1U7M802_TISCR|nr:MazG-like family protein [Tissierella creatinophila]OLS03427.1 MazG-like family protein [Tissierella creatinophila DSM 6911]